MDKQQLSIVTLLMVVAVLSPTVCFALISDEALQAQLPTGRTLLQAQQDCPVDFNGTDFTRLRSKCKGPDYPAGACCDALKEFACPYADLLNDLKNNCAVSLLNQINMHFPPGLFFDKCRDSNRGVQCPSYYSYSPAPSPTRLS